MSSVCAFMDRASELVSRALFALGCVAVLAILALTLGNIALRAFGQPMRGLIEISGYLGAAAVGLCLPRAQRAGSHIEVGMLDASLPRSVRVVGRGLTLPLCAAFMLLLAVEMYALGQFVREMDELIDGWNFSYDFLVFALAAGCAGQALVLINELVQAMLRIRERSQVKVLKVRDRGAGGLSS